ncbi:MAG: ATP-binding protein [Acidobacteriota bacterium]
MSASRWWNRRFQTSLDEMTRGVDQWTQSDLTGRIALPETQELSGLAASLDRLTTTCASRIRQLEAENAQLREKVDRDMGEAMRMAEIRRDLVANVSHELKTPLTAIRGFAETLADGALNDPEVAPRFLDRILQQCGRLEELLRDLLSLSRLEQDVRGTETLPLDLTAMARRAIEVLEPQASAKEITLHLEVDGEPRIVGTGSEVENLLLNLTENAVKYNRAGGDVRVRLAVEDEEAVIEVRDTGIGIPQDAIERIFERFYRVDKGRARDQGGTGLGLAIVKHTVRQLGGRIEVESRLGEGSVFRVSLPAADRPV